MLKEILENVRQQCPLIHNITNYVTVNDCANALLACGASPIMADDIDEVCDITSVCGGLNINIGTLNERTITAMLKAGAMANQLKHPVVFDPVGAGASKLRTKTAKELINTIDFAVIRGNMSEIKVLASVGNVTRGVDANLEDVVTKDNLLQAVSFAKEFSKKTHAVIAITGAIDIVAFEDKAYCVFNGHPMMSKITGTGCQLSAVIAAYVTANQENVLEAVTAAVAMMGVCGELAYDRLGKLDGNATYRNYIIDAIYNMSGDVLEELAKIEVY